MAADSEPYQLMPTPSQTAGPFVSIGTEWNSTGLVVPESTLGALSIVGHVIDGAGAPVTDAMLEFWQADPEGRFPSAPALADGSSSTRPWTGFARALTDREGSFRLVTLKPGPVPGPSGETQAPHVDISIFARGLLQRLVTRLYFPDEAALNASDPVLSGLGDAALASRLVASGEEGGRSLRFDIRLQGEQETVFFAPW
jgi:protocatechuate 3,4-dioxygenase, alpha subunit